MEGTGLGTESAASSRSHIGRAVGGTQASGRRTEAAPIAQVRSRVGAPAAHAVCRYMAEMTRCAFKLAEAFCLGLGLEPEALHPLFQVG